MRPLVYLAAPYRKPDPVANTSRAIAAARQLRDELDVDLIIPHLSLFEHLHTPGEDDYWLNVTMRLMRHCHAVYRLDGFSEGSDAEVAEAERMGKPVFYSLPPLAAWCNIWKAEQ